MFSKILLLASVQAITLEREPLLSWVEAQKGKKPKSHPVDYPVPNFGMDTDILATQASI